MVEKAAVISALPILQNQVDKFYNDKDEEFQLTMFHVSPSWFDIFGVELQEGKAIGDIEQQKYAPSAWVVNETALRQLGYETKDRGMLRLEDGTGLGYDKEKQEMVFYGKDKLPIAAIIKDHYIGHRTLGVMPCV